jgi:hypothetical protein
MKGFLKEQQTKLNTAAILQNKKEKSKALKRTKKL